MLSVAKPTHVCCRLGNLAAAGYVLDGAAAGGAGAGAGAHQQQQQQQLADLVGVCSSRISSMGPKQLVEVVWALAQVQGDTHTQV